MTVQWVVWRWLKGRVLHHCSESTIILLSSSSNMTLNAVYNTLIYLIRYRLIIIELTVFNFKMKVFACKFPVISRLERIRLVIRYLTRPVRYHHRYYTTNAFSAECKIRSRG